MAALGAKLRSRIVGLFSMDYIGHVCSTCRLYNHAYRLTYSFLTTFGQHFPTIVSDITTETYESERR